MSKGVFYALTTWTEVYHSVKHFIIFRCSNSRCCRRNQNCTCSYRFDLHWLYYFCSNEAIGKLRRNGSVYRFFSQIWRVGNLLRSKCKFSQGSTFEVVYIHCFRRSGSMLHRIAYLASNNSIILNGLLKGWRNLSPPYFLLACMMLQNTVNQANNIKPKI